MQKTLHIDCKIGPQQELGYGQHKNTHGAAKNTQNHKTEQKKHLFP